jgi:hypothetical protein
MQCLKKTDLEVIAQSLATCTNGEKKNELIQDICTKQLTGQSIDSPLVSHSDTDQNICIVDFGDPCHHYKAICNEAVTTIPALTFASI